jgi:hypothetical protein
MVQDGDIQQYPEKELDDVLDQKPKDSNILSMQELENVIQEMLSTLPKLNRAKLRLEMEKMSVELKDNPTTKDLNEGLALAQGYKDRLSEIYTLALRELKLRARTLDMLFDAVNYVSNGKSADKRRGEATMKYPMMIIHREAAETFLKEVEHVLQNIKSSHDSISRQITLMQIQLQLGEVRRSTEPGASASYPQNEAESVSAKSKNGELDWESF